MLHIVHIYLIIVVCVLELTFCYDKEMSVIVNARSEECFGQFVKPGEILDIEYQVIDAQHGDLDINFSLLNPSNSILVSFLRQSENNHRENVKVEGDHKFCFDNKFSMLSSKTVFFEMIVEKEGELNLGDEQWNDEIDGLTAEELYDMKVQDIMDYIGRIRMLITKAQQMQDMLRSYEARDRNLAEANFLRVNTWSLFQMCIMVMVGMLQVFMVRSIFETDSRLGKVWRKLGL